jgi:hypothetical protein
MNIYSARRRLCSCRIKLNQITRKRCERGKRIVNTSEIESGIGLPNKIILSAWKNHCGETLVKIVYGTLSGFRWKWIFFPLDDVPTTMNIIDAT